MSCLEKYRLIAYTGQTIRRRVTWIKKEGDEALNLDDIRIQLKFTTPQDPDTVVFDLSSTGGPLVDPARIEIIDSEKRQFDIYIDKAVNVIPGDFIGDVGIEDLGSGEITPVFRIEMEIKRGTL